MPEPSLSIILIENSFLFAITKSVKKKTDNTKQPTLLLPMDHTFFLNEMIATNSETRRKNMNPIAEPTLWILDAVVNISFDLSTLKKTC